MQRRGISAIEVLVILVIAIATILFIIPFMQKGAEAAQSDLDNLRSCGGGLVGSLGGGEGVCWSTRQCDQIGGGEEKDQGKFYWFYAGEGWGCPKAEELTEEQKSNGEGPYCCIQVDRSRNPPTLTQITTAKNQLVPTEPGTVSLVMIAIEDGKRPVEVYVQQGDALGKARTDSVMHIHYVPAQGESRCEFSGTVSFRSVVIMEMNLGTRDCTEKVSFGPLADVLAASGESPSSLSSGGGTLTLKVKGSQERTATFPIVPPALPDGEGASRSEIALLKGTGQSQLALMDGNPHARVAQSEAITLRYTPAQGEQQCTYTFVIGAGGSQLVRKENVAMRCTAQGTISLGTPLQILAQHNIQASSIDGGATFTIAVRGNEERVATFPICPKSGCA